MHVMRIALHHHAVQPLVPPTWASLRRMLATSSHHHDQETPSGLKGFVTKVVPNAGLEAKLYGQLSADVKLSNGTIVSFNENAS